MKIRFAALIFLLALAAPTQSSQGTQGAASWEFDRKTGSWTHKDTRIVMRKSMAGFQQDSSTSIEKDGTGSFAYLGKHCGITLVIEHRVTGGYPGAGDCTPRVRANYLRVMHESYGRTDSENSFTLRYRSGGKRGRGVGTVCHFVSFPTFGNMPAYSEVGAILIGDFLFKYRCSFLEEAGWADLNAFLRTLGIEKT